MEPLTVGQSASDTTLVPDALSNILITSNPFATGSNTEFASIDGTGNNLNNPTLGSAGTTLLTLAPTDYGDGGSALAGADRENVRVISNALGQQDTPITSSRNLTNLIWAFGQFLDHDLSLTPGQSREEAARNGEMININIPTGDPFLDPQGTGRIAIPVTRSEFVEGTGTGANNPREYHNEITHWIDLSNVYGSNTDRASKLRSFSQGLLRTGDGNLLPLAENGGNDNPGPTAANDLFLAGDARANENVVLSSMHTLFMREHNRLAGALADAHPTWSDEQLYQRARQINIAQWQNIVYNEYLPTLLGDGQVGDYSGYDATVDPRIGRTFSTAAYRFGHTQLSSEIERVDIDGNTIPEGNLSLFESFFPGYTMLQGTGIDPIIRGVAASLSQEVDVKLIDDIRNLLFNFGNFTSAQDLLALNLQRGRDHGLADYNSIRESFGLAKVTSFADITSNVETQQALASVYDDVNNIDAFIGMLAEDRLPGGSVGETITTVLVDQFTRLQSGDRFYYENIFTPEEIALIEETQLSDIILRNTDTPSIQENVFILAEEPPSEPIKTQLVGTNNGDVLAGTAGDDAIMANGGNDTVMAGAGNDDIWTTDATNRGANEVDYVDLGSGKNKIFLGDTTGSYYTADGWNDSVYIDNFQAGDDQLVLFGDASQYSVVSDADGTWVLFGNDGSTAVAYLSGVTSLDLNGSSVSYADDSETMPEPPVDPSTNYQSIVGTVDADSLIGSGTADKFLGNGGNDYAFGGNGADLFVLGDANNNFYAQNGWGDSIYIDDFTTGTDQLQLSGSASDYTSAADENGIWLYKGSVGGEAIAYLNGATSVDLSSFQYA